MRQVSYRLDDIRAEKLNKIFSFYGFSSTVESENHKALIDLLYELTTNRINSQIVGDKLAEHQGGEIDIFCNQRVTVPKLVRVLTKQNVTRRKKDGSTETYDVLTPNWALQDVSFCVQYERGKVRRQLKLESKHTCEICKLLTEKYLEEQTSAVFEPAEIKPERIPVTVQQNKSQSEPIKARPQNLPDATWICDKTNEKVYYTVCLKCRHERYLTFKSCILANPKIGLALAYWQSQDKK